VSDGEGAAVDVGLAHVDVAHLAAVAHRRQALLFIHQGKRMKHCRA
jgi:hypothetical protein